MCIRDRGGRSSGDAALTEMLASAPGHSAVSQRVEPCSADLAPWPDASTAPLDVAALVDQTDRGVL
eukprot:3932308-Pyramimonas_sp.AAC.1